MTLRYSHLVLPVSSQYFRLVWLLDIDPHHEKRTHVQFHLCWVAPRTHPIYPGIMSFETCRCTIGVTWYKPWPMFTQCYQRWRWLLKTRPKKVGFCFLSFGFTMVYHICHFAFGMLSQVLLQGKTRTKRQNFELHTYLQIGSIDFKLWFRFQTIANVRLQSNFNLFQFQTFKTMSEQRSTIFQVISTLQNWE